MALPDDLILDAADEVAIRQNLTLVALGKAPADLAIEVGKLLSVHSRQWHQRGPYQDAGRQRHQGLWQVAQPRGRRIAAAP